MHACTQQKDTLLHVSQSQSEACVATQSGKSLFQQWANVAFELAERCSCVLISIPVVVSPWAYRHKTDELSTYYSVFYVTG